MSNGFHFILFTVLIGSLLPCETKAKMQFRFLVSFLGCLLAVQGRENKKSYESLPAITSSLVNLGKMDISFHFNSKDYPYKMNTRVSPLLFPKLKPLEETCPCSSLRGIKDNPSELLSRILMSSDLFSYNREPVTSNFCCDSHEPVQEDIITFEIDPKTPMLNTYKNNPKLPFIFENFYPKKQMISMPSKPMTKLSMPSYKPKMPYMFPKKEDSFSVTPAKIKQNKKEDIQIVGDKEIKNNVKTMTLFPSVQENFQYSVKKDLTAQEKNETMKQTEKKEIEVDTTTSINDNALK